MNDAMTKKRRRLFANKMHRDMFFLVFFAALIPTIVTSIFLFYLIFHITAEQFGIPEVIARNLFPAAHRVGTILSIVMPIIVLIILLFAYKVTHRIVGPYDRILRELTECLDGKRQGPILIREKDKFRPLIDKINQLLEKLQMS